MNYYPQEHDRKQLENAKEQEENYLNLFTYLRRRYPHSDLDKLKFYDLIALKNQLEGPRSLRFNEGEIATVRKR